MFQSQAVTDALAFPLIPLLRIEATGKSKRRSPNDYRVSINSTSKNRSNNNSITEIQVAAGFPLIPLLRIEATQVVSSRKSGWVAFPLIPLLRIEAPDYSVFYGSAINDRMFPLIPLLRIEATIALFTLPPSGIIPRVFPLIPLLRIEATLALEKRIGIRGVKFPLIPLLRIEATHYGPKTLLDDSNNLTFPLIPLLRIEATKCLQVTNTKGLRIKSFH